MSELRDKVIGCILGGAIGDAMGGPYEGRQGPFNVSPGILGPLSDDTQLTLATCEAIIELANRNLKESPIPFYGGFGSGVFLESARLLSRRCVT